MARIRTIKPEFWASEQVAKCDFQTRLLFIGLWNYADDGGVIPNRPMQIRIQIFPAEAFTDDDIVTMLATLCHIGLLLQFANHGNTYFYVTGWEKHQKIDRPNPKYPKPFDDGSTIIQGTLDEHSSGIGKEGIGEERKGTARVDELRPEDIPIPPEIAADPFPTVWTEWIAYRRDSRISTRERCLRAQLTALAPLGPLAAADCLRISIRNGWKGIFPEKLTNGTRTQRSRTTEGKRYRDRAAT